MYSELYDRRDHHRDACLKDAADWLLSHDVTDVFVGDLTGVLSTHWSANVNEKTHNFWSHRQLTNQLENTFELAGLDVEFVAEYDTSSECPHCGSESVDHDRDRFSCADCEILVQADIAAQAIS